MCPMKTVHGVEHMNRIGRLFKRPKEVDSKWIRLLENNGYPEAMRMETGQKLERLPMDLQEAIQTWDATGVLPELEEEGFCVSELVEYFGLNEVAAFLMMDWLRRDPEAAKLALAEPVSKLKMEEDAIEELIRVEEADWKSQQAKEQVTENEGL